MKKSIIIFLFVLGHLDVFPKVGQHNTDTTKLKRNRIIYIMDSLNYPSRMMTYETIKLRKSRKGYEYIYSYISAKEILVYQDSNGKYWIKFFSSLTGGIKKETEFKPVSNSDLLDEIFSIDLSKIKIKKRGPIKRYMFGAFLYEGKKSKNLVVLQKCR